MNKLFYLLFASLTVLCLGDELPTINVPLAPMQQHQQQQRGFHLKNIEIIKDIKTFIQQNPNLRLIRLDKKTPENRFQSVKYTLGHRISGDRRVAQYADTSFYPAPKDVSIKVTYPGDSVVTSLDINCLQSNTDGNAYVVDGGIGQRFISIILEAKQTERFSYNIHVYGKD